MAKSESTITIAAAPSLSPDELPAVMLKPSISGCSGVSAASFSIVLPRRGCSSVAKVTVSPSRRFTSIGKISSSNLPLSIASTARTCDCHAQWSISSRVTFAFCAEFHPTVIDMSKAGALGDLGVTRRHPRRHLVGAEHPLHGRR